MLSKKVERKSLARIQTVSSENGALSTYESAWNGHSFVSCVSVFIYTLVLCLCYETRQNKTKQIKKKTKLKSILKN